MLNFLIAVMVALNLSSRPALAQTSIQHEQAACRFWTDKIYDKALSEAQLGVKSVNSTAEAHINLAAILQGLSRYKDAIKQYEIASNLEPGSWRAQLGIVQCLALTSKTKQALQILHTLDPSEQEDATNLYYFGDTSLQLGDYKTARLALARSLSLSSGSRLSFDLRSSVKQSLYLAYLKSRDYEKARLLEPEIMEGKPKQKLIYIESARYLCNAIRPSEGEKVLMAAKANMDYSADLFWSLSQIFQTFSQDTKIIIDPDTRLQWQKLAETSLRFAICADPNQPKFRLVLAGILDDQNRRSEALQLLADSGSSNNRLGTFARACLHQRKNDIAAGLKQALASKFQYNTCGASELPIVLRALHFKLNHLSCGCRIASIEYTLRKSESVVYAVLSPDTSHSGLIIYRPTMQSNKLFDFALHRGETLEILNDESVSSISQIASLATPFQQESQPDLLTELKQIQPRIVDTQRSQPCVHLQLTASK